ncbi:MAG: type III-B CRISPR-associated protein Cas10/Cmr2 [Lentisphaerae bacterium]|nr:type III-B CRISPR-associated protein Cas10/Cmr2 [Lentisphaerota bacterium]
MSDTRTDTAFWQRKLMAFLHDAPDKSFDIGLHEAHAAAVQRAAGFTDEASRADSEKSIKPADWFSASAERFVFPKGACSHTFKSQPLFIHPLSSEPYRFPPEFGVNAAPLSDAIQSAIGGIETDDWHERFFLFWRRWMENATAKHPALAFLPADTRIPDHTIWNHMSFASAMAPCIEGREVRPELLLFQLGPVQDFIAQARSTRDLWSGSYLISWLMAHAIKAVTDEIGPDAVIFPSLRGNGIFDALHKDTYYAKPWKTGDGGATETTWERLKKDKGGWANMADWLLTPTLPNRFFAIVPHGRGAELAAKAHASLTGELGTVSEAVWAWVLDHGGKAAWKARWNAQIAAFPQVAWAVQPWLDRETCLAATEQLAKNEDDPVGVAGRILSMLDLGEKRISEGDRDRRYYTSDAKDRLNNPGLLWSAHYALLDAKLAERRNTRDFAQWNPVGDAAVKDSLSGKDECMGDEAFWVELTKAHKDLFTAASHRYGAMNLIKRLWCRPDAVAYLPQKLGLDTAVVNKALRADSTQEIAARNASGSGVPGPVSPYIAVLALDGDEMGKWVSGAKTPQLLKQLAPQAKAYLTANGATGLSRLLTPSYHLQFSEALANFAMYQARTVVEHYDGELIYAGGDDVLAILPSTRAIACAQALRDAFRTDFADGRLFPGSRSEVSVGIAIGHQNAPLQMLVREAQKAEKRAKGVYGRAALAISLYKRSGETIEWGCKWESNALELMREITTLNKEGKLSGRFPYALAALLQPYALDRPDTDLVAMLPVIQTDVRHVLSRQGSGLSPQELESLAHAIDAYLAVCWSPPAPASGVQSPASAKPQDPGPKTPDSGRRKPTPPPHDFLNLFLAETFINRLRGEN